MKFKLLISAVIAVVLLVGCGTKRKFFEPEVIVKELKYNGALPSKIVDYSRDGATLENGQIITKDGLSSFVLPKDFRFFGLFHGHIIAGDDNGNLHVYDESHKLIYQKKFNRAIASASLNGGDLALIDATNRLSIVSLRNGEPKFIQKEDDVYALDARIAAPFFMSTLVLFPTLDGKIVIVDRDSNRVIRDVILSSEQFFNNVIYLNAIGDRMVVATADRVISINPTGTSFYEDDIKEVMALEDKIYIFTKDGRVVLMDVELGFIKEEKFQFAFFSGISKDKSIYIVEKKGHLIVLDEYLNRSDIYKLPDEIEDMSFVTNKNLFVGDKILSLEQF